MLARHVNMHRSPRQPTPHNLRDHSCEILAFATIRPPICLHEYFAASNGAAKYIYTLKTWRSLLTLVAMIFKACNIRMCNRHLRKP